MKRIGLVGGLTPESTVEYYRALIELNRRGSSDPLRNPVIVIYSVNLGEIVEAQRAGREDDVVEILSTALEGLRAASAQIAAITANTPHLYFDRLVERTTLPLVSILDAACDATKALGCRKVLLLGTGRTMESAMYPSRFAAGRIEVVVPDEGERDFVDRAIYGELSVGVTSEKTKARFVEVCERHVTEGKVDGVVLGCTEIPLLLKDGDVSVPMIDTTRVHAEAIFAAASAG